MHDGHAEAGSTRRRVHRAGPRPPAGSDVVGFGAALTVLVIGVVPAIAIAAGISPLLPLVAAIGGYGLAAIATGNVVPAVVAGIPVLATINAEVPIRRGPVGTVDLAVVVGDAAVLAGAVLLAGWLAGRASGVSLADRALTDRSIVDRSPAGRSLTGSLERAWRTLGWPAAFLTGFAIWALAVAPFAAHDAATAAVFGINQFRYVAYFAVAAGLVAIGYATLRALAVTFAVAIAGHACYALVQFANGHTLGMTALGETTRTNQLTIALVGETLPMGRFLGGLVGNNAAFASLAIPAAAVLVWLGVDAAGNARRLAILGIALLGVLCVPLSQYDSVTLGFASALGLAVAFVSGRYWPRSIRAFVERRRVPLLWSSLVAAAVAIAAAIAVGAGFLPEALPLVEGRNLDTRLADYRRAVELGLEHPVTGYGGGNVEPVAAELGFSGDYAIHSIALSYLAETGVVGLALWLGALVAIAIRAVRLAWSDHPDAAVAAALCAGAVGFLVVGSFDQLWDNHTSMGAFWLFAGAIAGSYRTWTRDRSAPRGR